MISPVSLLMVIGLKPSPKIDVQTFTIIPQIITRIFSRPAALRRPAGHGGAGAPSRRSRWRLWRRAGCDPVSSFGGGTVSVRKVSCLSLLA